jgi:hypothetical protein
VAWGEGEVIYNGRRMPVFSILALWPFGVIIQIP